MAIEMNTGKAAMPQGVYESLSKLSGNEAAELKEVVGRAMEVLAGANLKVSKSDTAGAEGTAEKKTTGSTNVPALDNPADSNQVAANLEKLISYLQLDNEERQAAMAKDRIEIQQNTLDGEHKDRMAQIDDSIKKMKEAESASKWSRFFGWVGAILSVVAAVAVTIVSGGTAAAFAIAGAVLAVTALTMNETGAMDKLTEKLAKHMQESYGWSKSKAQLFASLVCNLSIAVLSLGCSVGGMVAGFAAAAAAASNAAAAVNTANTVTKVAGMSVETAKTVQNVITIANTSVGAASLLAGGLNTYYTKRSEDSKADTTELQKFITQLQQRLDECEEELEQLLEQLESNIGTVAQMISSSTDTSDEIARNLGAMA